jgi:hypothetical protein
MPPQTVNIPAGDYKVGAEDAPALLQPPQRGFIKTPTTPPETVSLAAFSITADVIRGRDVAHLEAYAHIGAEQVVRVAYPLADVIAASLGGRLPTRQQWEVAARGAEGLLYPWGNTADREKLTLERVTYSVDESSTMGYYDYSEEVYFIEDFGPYAEAVSPFGLRHLVRAGREWNAQGVQRSLSDLGGMAIMIPGNRPRTWDSEGLQARGTDAFSGPSLVHYTAEPFHEEAGFRVVFEGGG